MPPWVASKWGVEFHGLRLHGAPSVEQVIHMVEGVVLVK